MLERQQKRENIKSLWYSNSCFVVLSARGGTSVPRPGGREEGHEKRAGQGRKGTRASEEMNFIRSFGSPWVDPEVALPSQWELMTEGAQPKGQSHQSCCEAAWKRGTTPLHCPVSQEQPCGQERCILLETWMPCHATHLGAGTRCGVYTNILSA